MKLLFVIAVLLAAAEGLPSGFSRVRRDVDPATQRLEFKLLRNEADDYRDIPFDSFHPSDNVIYGLPGEAAFVVNPDPRDEIEEAVIRDVFFDQDGFIVHPNANDFDNFDTQGQDVGFGSFDEGSHFGDFESDEIGFGSRPKPLGHHNQKPVIKDVKKPIVIGDGVKLLSSLSSEEDTRPTTVDDDNDGLVADNSDSIERDQPKLQSHEDDGLEDDDIPVGTGAQISLDKNTKPLKVPILPFTKSLFNNKTPVGNKFVVVNKQSTSTPSSPSSEFIPLGEDDLNDGLIDDDSEEKENKKSVETNSIPAPVRNVIQLSSKARVVVLPDGIAILSSSDEDIRKLRKVIVI